MQSFVCQQLEQVHVRPSRAARDAFKKRRDDTDPMRQTGGRTARRGGTLRKSRGETTRRLEPRASVSAGAFFYDTRVLGLVCQIRRHKNGAADEALYVARLFTAYGQIYARI